MFFLACSYKKQALIIDNNSLRCDTVFLPNIDHRSLIFYTTDKGNIAFSYISKSKTHICKNVAGQIIDSFKIPLKYQQNPHLLYSISDSSLYILNKDANTIEIINPHSSMQYEYVASFEVEKSLSAVFFQPEMYEKEFLLMSIPHYFISEKKQREQYFKSKILGIFSLTDNKILLKKTIAPFPIVYQKKYYHSCYPITTTIHDGIVSYIFNNTDSLHLYDILQDKETVIKLSVQDFQMREFNMDSLSNTYIQNYRVSNPYYEKIVYDPISKCHAIFQTEGMNTNSLEDGFMSIYTDKPLNIYIIDSNFQTVKKIRFSSQKGYHFYSSFFYNNKLFIPNDSETDTTAMFVYHLSNQ